MVQRGIIFYTDSRIREPIKSVVMDFIKKAGLPIISCSLNKPLDFGENIVFEGQRSYPTYIRQIKAALGASTADYVFFTEHDCLYPKGYFSFVPPKDDVFYYNSNCWRWWIKLDTAIGYDHMFPLSCLCVNREFALEHYKARVKHMEEIGLDEFRSREPRWARRWGYEPGTKPRRRGGFSDDTFDTWRSEFPVIDIRHKGCFTKLKVTLDSFKHQPKNWRETPIDEISGWNLKELFGETR